jgi:shikimate kinase
MAMEIIEKSKIFLIGYMGAGKTTVGKLLADKLNWSFIDVDGFIENRYRQTIAAIFEEKGEAGFRKIERRTLQEISAFENVVISTGGGLPCFFDNMDWMNQTGITIYLKADVNELVNRLNFDKQKRPLIRGKNLEELREFVETNLEKREFFYNRAMLTFNVQNCSRKKEMEQWIEKLLNNFT